MRKALYLVFAFGIISGALAVSGKNSYELKRQPKVGDSLKYHVDAEFKLDDRSAKMSLDQTETVAKVESDGSFEIETKASDGKFVVDGHEQEMPSDAGTRGVYNAFGTLLTIPEASDPVLYRKAYMIEFIAPDHSVHVGDNWQQEFKADSPQGVPAKSTYKVEVIEKVNGINAAKVHFSYTELEGTAPITSEGDTWVNTNDGSVVKLEASFKNFPMGASGVPVQGTFSMKRSG